MSKYQAGRVRFLVRSVALTTVTALALGAAPVLAAGHSYNLTDIGPTSTGSLVYLNYPDHVAGTTPSRHRIWFYDSTLHQIPGPAAASEVVAGPSKSWQDMSGNPTY